MCVCMCSMTSSQLHTYISKLMTDTVDNCYTRLNIFQFGKFCFLNDSTIKINIVEFQANLESVVGRRRVESFENSLYLVFDIIFGMPVISL